MSSAQAFVDALNFKVFPQLGYSLSGCGCWWEWKRGGVVEERHRAQHTKPLCDKCKPAEGN